jgi:hypothetical protein
LPRKGYKSTGDSSLPQELINAIDRLKEDPKFIQEMRRKGFKRKISRALVLRIAILELLERRGVDTSEIFGTEGK